MPVDARINIKNFNITADHEPGNYRLLNFRASAQFGWMCRLDDPNGITVLSSEVELVLLRVMERNYPISLGNLGFGFRKIGLDPDADIPKIENKRPWADTMVSILLEMKKFLPNVKYECFAKGTNFVTARICSKKQAKKVSKSATFKAFGNRASRRGREICIRETL